MSEKNRQDLPPGLWVIATPIGNLADLSERASGALEAADEILCEDTRRTLKLMQHLKLSSSKKLARLDAHATPKDLNRALESLEEGKSLALVTDAGTPGVSDPGAALVKEALARGIRVTPVPGPSAVAALVSVSGTQSAGYAFLGYFPRKKSDQDAALAQAGGPCVWFESPERIRATLQVLAEALPEARLVAAKELTKLHERLFAGTTREVSENLQALLEEDKDATNGEWCFLLEAPEEETNKAGDWALALEACLSCGVNPSTAAKAVSQKFGIGRNDVYSCALVLTGKKTGKK